MRSCIVCHEPLPEGRYTACPACGEPVPLRRKKKRRRRYSRFMLPGAILLAAVVAIAVFASLPAPKTGDGKAIEAVNSHDWRLYQPYWEDENLTQEYIVLPDGRGVFVGECMRGVLLSLDSSRLFYATELPTTEDMLENPDVVPLYDLYLADFSSGPALVAQGVSVYFYSPLTGSIYYILPQGGLFYLAAGAAEAEKIADGVTDFVVAPDGASAVYEVEGHYFLYTHQDKISLKIADAPQGAALISIANNGGLLCYAMPVADSQLLTCFTVPTGEVNTLMLSQGQLARILLNYACTELIVVDSEGLFHYTLPDGFVRLDDGGGNVYNAGVQLAMRSAPGLYAATLALEDFACVVYGLPMENMADTGETPVTLYAHSGAGRELVAETVTSLHCALNTEKVTYLAGGALYQMKISGGRPGKPAQLAKRVASFVATRDGKTVYFLQIENPGDITGKLYRKTGGWFAKLVEKEVAPGFTISADGAYCALVTNYNAATGAGDAAMYYGGKFSTRIGYGVARLFSITQTGSLLFTKNVVEAPSALSPSQCDLYSFSGGDAMPLRQAVYVYHW